MATEPPPTPTPDREPDDDGNECTLPRGTCPTCRPYEHPADPHADDDLIYGRSTGFAW